MVFGARVALLGRHIRRSPKRHYLGRVFATLASLVLGMPIYDTQVSLHKHKRSQEALTASCHSRSRFLSPPCPKNKTPLKKQTHSLTHQLTHSLSQCGAKLFRNSSELRAVLAMPFLTRWVFDVEILARFDSLFRAREGGGVEGGPSGRGGVGGVSLQEVVYEYPLHRWVDVGGSKVKPLDIFKMAAGLLRIRVVYYLHDWPAGTRRTQLYIAALWILPLLLAVMALLALLLPLIRR